MSRRGQGTWEAGLGGLLVYSLLQRVLRRLRPLQNESRIVGEVLCRLLTLLGVGGVTLQRTGNRGAEMLCMCRSRPKVTHCETSREVGKRSWILPGEWDTLGTRSEASEGREWEYRLVYSSQPVLPRSHPLPS